ncbi:hypothetical protein [Streptomyces finlayi]|uniref:2'-5' RNA ligase family protein n=1 Tax=Streptomyces finlayi TaxID=67296 RepID=A0A7G7BGM7_9ACTN|nr:hypothetical protein [Streptomyces finlayi]QNE74492.1 hypothetical protein F0344_07600 [Streptomyces finlayi]
MESFFSPKRTWAQGPYLHFVAKLDDPAYVEYTRAHHGLLAEYGHQVGTVPAEWLHWTVLGIHHSLTRDQVERAVERVRYKLAMDSTRADVQMGPVWPGPSAVTVAMYPETALARVSNQVREAVCSVDGITLRPAMDRPWPHSTLSYFRTGDVHDADFNRRLRSIRPDRADINVSSVHAVYMHQDLDLGYYRWDHLAVLPLGSSSVLTVRARLDELVTQAEREGNPLWAAAWRQTRTVLAPVFGDEKFTPPWSTMDVGSDYVEAAGALAVSLYLLARERSVAPADISEQDLDELADSAPGAGRLRTYERIRTRLVALGHALDDADDPVTVRWRALDYVHEEPAYGDLDDSSLRAGHAGENGLRHVLAPFYRERIRF